MPDLLLFGLGVGLGFVVGYVVGVSIQKQFQRWLNLHPQGPRSYILKTPSELEEWSAIQERTQARLRQLDPTNRWLR